METSILETDTVPKELKIGQKYHVNWAAKGCVWIFNGYVNNNQVELQTPKTKKKIYTSVTSLRLLNADALRAANERIRKLNSKNIQLDLF